MIEKIQIRVGVLFVVLGIFIPGILQQHMMWIALPLILLGGIPHGAVDHLIFKRLKIKFFGAQTLLSFIVIYVGIGLGFVLLWLFAPFNALVLFILMSIYHFGQEHLAKLAVKNSWLSLCRISWGVFVVLYPLVWHSDATASYIGEITGIHLAQPPQILNIIVCASGGVFYLCCALGLKLASSLSLSWFLRECSQVIILSVLFALTPLLIGFSIYFVFWHSLHAIEDQIQFFRERNASYSTWRFLSEASFISVVSIVFICISVSKFNMLEDGNSFAYIFMIIAFITMPHILLFDIFYQHRKTGE